MFRQIFCFHPCPVWFVCLLPLQAFAFVQQRRYNSYWYSRWRKQRSLFPLFDKHAICLVSLFYRLQLLQLYMTSQPYSSATAKINLVIKCSGSASAHFQLSVENDLFYLFCNVFLICLIFNLKWSCSSILLELIPRYFTMVWWVLAFFFFFNLLLVFLKAKLPLEDS